jgi:hypothetical protein
MFFKLIEERTDGLSRFRISDLIDSSTEFRLEELARALSSET